MPCAARGTKCQPGHLPGLGYLELLVGNKMRLLLAAIILSVQTMSVNAGFVAQSYSDYVRQTDQALAMSYALQREDDRSLLDLANAKAVAAMYFFTGPCRGGVKKADGSVDNAKTSDAVAVMTGDFSSPVFRLVAPMIGYLHASQDMRRAPLEKTCKYAAETAISEIPVGSEVSYCYNDSFSSANTDIKCTTVKY